MNSFDFRNIVNEIMDKEKMDLVTVAAKANADRSYLSKLINSKEPLTVGPKVIGKIERAFPNYFDGNDANNIRKERAEPTPMQILAVLAEAFRTQAEILRSIESKMARADALATVDTNLIRTLAVVESARIVQDRSQIELLDHLRKLSSGTAPPSQAEGRKSRQKNGDGQKRGKSPA